MTSVDAYTAAPLSAEQWAIVVAQLARGPHLQAPLPLRGGHQGARPLSGSAPWTRSRSVED